MAKRPRRLRRVLKRNGMSEHLLEVTSPEWGTLTDDAISSVTIHRGKAGRGGGHDVSTIELELPGLYTPESTGLAIDVDLSWQVAYLVAGMSQANSSLIRPRFRGRLGASDVEDTGKRYTTNYRGASWANMLTGSKYVMTTYKGMHVSELINGYFAQAGPQYHVSSTWTEPTPEAAAADGPLTFSDAVGNYVAEIGLLMRERRNGTTDLLPLNARYNDAMTRLDNDVPLTRSQAISPAKWDQRNETAALDVRYTAMFNGVATTQLADVAVGADRIRERLDLDWKHIQVDDMTGDLYREAYGRAYEANPRQFVVPSVTVDLLHLIDSGKQYHRDQLGQLLTLEEGDPVFFASDWHWRLAGVHFANGIIERITPDSWELELQLSPWAHTMGRAPSPIPRGRTWNSAAERTWDGETIKWNEA